jgi:restriction system protein
LNIVFQDTGANLGIPYSSNGRDPVEYYFGSQRLNEKYIPGIKRLAESLAGSYVLVSKTLDDPVIDSVGIPLNHLDQSLNSYEFFLSKTGLKRIERYIGMDTSHAACSLLLQTIITPLGKVNDGQIIECLSIPWLEITRQLEKDPEFLYQFTKHHRKFEEFLAATYDRMGFTVTLTPSRGDRGRDVIAELKGEINIRILDQAKAYSPNHLVTHDDVRAMLGTLSSDLNSSKGIITTTSDFQPGILKEPELVKFMPNRLELKNGAQLTEWLTKVRTKFGDQIIDQP